MPVAISKPRAVNRQRGFTLVELVVGVVVSALALTFISTVFFNNAGRSVEPLLQIRAANLAQSLMDEVLSKNYDQQSPIGGVPACATCSPALGPESSETRLTYNDVDDYQFYCQPSGVPVVNALGENPAGYDNYRMSICVIYDSDYNGSADAGSAHIGSLAKRIEVAVTPPVGAGLGSPIVIHAYRGNF